jgi:hypothetical protein
MFYSVVIFGSGVNWLNLEFQRYFLLSPMRRHPA